VRGEVEEAIAINALKRAATEHGKYTDDYSIAAKKKEKVGVLSFLCFICVFFEALLQLRLLL
jgi:hypothetical protein